MVAQHAISLEAAKLGSHVPSPLSPRLTRRAREREEERHSWRDKSYISSSTVSSSRARDRRVETEETRHGWWFLVSVSSSHSSCLLSRARDRKDEERWRHRSIPINPAWISGI